MIAHMRGFYSPLPAMIAAVAVGDAAEVGFNRDIRPILSNSCFACHGPDAAHGRQADLRLDEREGALAGGESGSPAIVPGDPEASAIILRITSRDPDEVMPPPDSHIAALAPEQVELLRQWIAQGAEYEPHWSFVAPLKAAVPAQANAVDHWIAEGLRREKIKPAPEADPRTLIRRVTLDLTGLPPTPEEISAFLADPSPAAAYEALVERLLASPRFGEHFAVAWMDAARYADTNGFSIDGGRHQWLWRDWVIRSFNENQPFDEFLTEQIAGDLLPDASEAQITATGFNRNHAITHEGGTIPEENLVNYAADRVKTTSEAFLGLTMACAQCHDHKFDPLSQRDYYRFFAFFNTLDDAGLDGDGGNNARPIIQAASVLADPAEAERVQGKLAALRAEFEAPAPEAQALWVQAQREDLARSGRDLSLELLEVTSVNSPNGNPDRLTIHDDRSVTVAHGDFAAYSVLAKLPVAGPPITGLRVVFSASERSEGKLGFGKMAGLEGNFHLGGFTLSLAPFPAENVDLNASLRFSRLSASSTQPGHDLWNIVNSDPLAGWAPATGSETPQHLSVTFAEPVPAGAMPYLTAELLFNRGGGTSPARFQLFAMTGTDDGSPHPDDITAILLAENSARSPGEAARLQEYFHGVSPEKAYVRHQIANLEERLAVLTRKHPVLVMNTSENPRTTHILDRGVYSSPLEAVAPGVPEVLPPLSTDPGFDAAAGGFPDRPANRLDLARWMVRRDNPLTARVAVNRMWEHFFGRGLSSASADLGSQGTWPSHPELLDWLAVDFMENGWDRKRLIRRILSSETYRRSSNADAASLARDPSNEWLGRGPRFRLGAEQIRDQALAVSGLLAERIGGPSVRPYQPGDLWRQVSHYGSSPATAQTFVQDHGEKLYRRSLYTYWKRTLPPVNLAVFDAPNREVCSIGRIPTNTPLQALVTLNDPQFVEAARAFAQRVLENPDMSDDASRLRIAFESITARLPEKIEADTLASALARERERFTADPAAAGELLRIGESPRNPAIPAAEHAAWTQIAALLLNLSESITRN